MISKKSQIQLQIFVYILALIVVGLVLTYGYSAIRGFQEKSFEISKIQFQENFKNIVDSQNHDYMSVVRKELALPSKYDTLIMVDLNITPPNSLSPFAVKYPIVWDSWANRVQRNVFMIGEDIVDGFYVGDLYVNNTEGNITVYAPDRIIKLRLTGLGGKTKIEPWV